MQLTKNLLKIKKLFPNLEKNILKIKRRFLKKRVNILARRFQFLKTLDFIILCLEGGMPLFQALETTAQMIDYEFSKTFLQHILHKYHLGCSPQSALELSKGQNEDTDQMIEIIQMSQQYGTHLIANLQGFSNALQGSLAHQLEEESSKTPVKMIFPIVFFIFPTIFLLFAGSLITDILQILSF